MVSASVTRWPSTNTGSLPNRVISWLTSGPPPWTTITSTPTYRSRTTSSTKASNPAVPMAAPPYFTTTVQPDSRLIQGRASWTAGRLGLQVRSREAGERLFTWCTPS